MRRSEVIRVGMVIMFLGVYSLMAQVLVVRVYDGKTGHPVPGVQCTVDSCIVGMTNERGWWQGNILAAAVSIEVELRKLGYRDWRKRIAFEQQKDTIEVFAVLYPQPLRFDSIVVTSYRSLLHEYATSIVESDPASIDQLLDFLPQVSVQRRAGIAAEPIVQGMGWYRYETRIDGVPVLPACTDGMDPISAYIEPEVFESVSLGTEMVAGSLVSIDFRTIKAELSGKGLGVGVQTRYSTVNRELRSAVQLKWQGQSNALIADVIYRQADDYMAAGGQKIHPSGYRKWNYRLYGRWRLSSDFQIEAQFLGDDGYDIGFPALPMDTRYDRLRLVNVSAHYRLHQLPVYWVRLGLFGSRVDHYMDDWKRDVPVHMDMPGQTWVAGGRLDVRAHVASMLVNLQIEQRWEQVGAEMTMYAPGAAPMWMPTWPKMMRSRTTLAMQSGIALGDWGVVEPSVQVVFAHTRLQRNTEVALLTGLVGSFPPQRSDIAASLGLSAAVQVGKGLRSQVQIFYQQRIPHQSELYGFYLFQSQDGYDYIGRPTLQSEQRWLSSLELRYAHKHVGMLVKLTLQYYQQYIGAAVINWPAMTIGAKGVKQYRNYGDASRIGIDIAGWAELFPRLRILGILKSNTGRLDDGRLLPATQPWTLRLLARYHWSQWRIEMSTEMAVTNQEVAQWVGETPDPAYMVWNARIIWKVLPFLQLHIGVENIGDCRYHRFSDWNDLPQPGRNVFILLKGQWE